MYYFLPNKDVNVRLVSKLTNLTFVGKKWDQE